jgi:hypothetical protein
MAKEADSKKSELSIKMKFALWFVGVIFTAGILYHTVNSHGVDIRENREDIVTVKEDVHRIELDAKDIKSVAIRAAEAMESIDTKLETIQKTQHDQATVQAVNSEKLKTLTKD